jgi:nitrate/nitrite transporter NarK
MYVLAPALGLAYGWQSVWWFGAIFALVAFVLYWLLGRTPPEIEEEAIAAEPPNLGRAMANRHIWLLGLSFGCFNLVVLALSTFLPTFLTAERGYTLATASFVTSLTMIVTIGSAPLGGWLSDRLGSRKLLIVGPFIIMAVMLLFPFKVDGWLIPAYLIFLGLVVGGLPTATFAAVPELMSKAQLVGIGMAVVALGQNLGMFVGPVFFGQAAELTSWAVAGYLLIPVALIGTIAAWLIDVR